jgi:hypothetical protein
MAKKAELDNKTSVEQYRKLKKASRLAKIERAARSNGNLQGILFGP